MVAPSDDVSCVRLSIPAASSPWRKRMSGRLAASAFAGAGAKYRYGSVVPLSDR